MTYARSYKWHEYFENTENTGTGALFSDERELRRAGLGSDACRPIAISDWIDAIIPVDFGARDKNAERWVPSWLCRDNRSAAPQNASERVYSRPVKTQKALIDGFL